MLLVIVAKGCSGKVVNCGSGEQGGAVVSGETAVAGVVMVSKLVLGGVVVSY